MKIDINTQRFTLEKYAKSCKFASVAFLVIGIMTIPLGIIFICLSVHYSHRKKLALDLIAQQDAADLSRSAALEREFQEIKDRHARDLEDWQNFLNDNVVDRTFHTKVVGVSYRNDDGSSRQEVIENASIGEPVDLEFYDYKGSPACAVYYLGEQMGNISASVAEEFDALDDSYTVTAEISDITGGWDGKLYGCNLLVTVYKEK